MNNFNFLNQVCPKRVIPIKTEKLNITIEFCMFELVYVPNWLFEFFGSNLHEKGIPILVNISIEFCTSKLVYNRSQNV